MNRYERILETLKCPCGGEVVVNTYPIGESPDIGGIECLECGAASGLRKARLDALIAWLILTGGPITGVVPLVSVGINTERHISYSGTDEDPYGNWWLFPGERTEPVLRPWLEEEIDE